MTQVQTIYCSNCIGAGHIVVYKPKQNNPIETVRVLKQCPKCKGVGKEYNLLK